MARRRWPGWILLGLMLAGACADSPPRLPEGLEILATGRADLVGDGGEHRVHLIGHRPADDSAFRDRLALLVAGEAQPWPLPSGAASGYEPRLELVDLTGDGRPEVLVTADTGGSGGIVAAAVVMVVAHGDRWRHRTLFDASAGPAPELAGGFVAGERAELRIRAPGLATREETLDLSGRYAELGEAAPFTADGELRQPVQLWGGAVMAVEAASLADGRPALRLVQQVRGLSNADRLAEVATLLVWEDAAWTTAELDLRPLP